MKGSLQNPEELLQFQEFPESSGKNKKFSLREKFPILIRFFSLFPLSMESVKSKFSWKTASIVLCLILSFPTLTILFSLFSLDLEVWKHLWETRLLELFWNTIRLSLGVGAGAFLLGTSLAWVVVMYQFPGKNFFNWALILPLAIPAYVIGFVFLTTFDYSGAVPTLFRESFGVSFPEIKSWGGVVIVMSLVLYPYVYLMARAAFQEQNSSMLEVAQSLGVSRKMLFWRVALPLARPAIAIGVSLALMESLADFGTVALFSYDTFTTAIYEVWYGMFDRVAATQLACLLLFFNLFLFWFEQKTRGKSRYYQTHGTLRQFQPFQVHGLKRIIVITYPLLVLGVAFLFPVGILVFWASKYVGDMLDMRFLEHMGNTLFLGVAAGLIVVLISIILSYGKRLAPSKIVNFSTRFASMGYALPGSVIAVGILVPMAWTDHFINDLAEDWFGISTGLLLTGSIIGLLFAFVVRFLTAGFNAIESGLSKISPSMDMAARSLGSSQRGLLWRVHLPLIRPALFAGFILVLVDVMKEMPATLLMRPFGFETLSTWVWQLSSEALAEEAALPSLAIVITGLLPVLILVKLGNKK